MDITVRLYLLAKWTAMGRVALRSGELLFGPLVNDYNSLSMSTPSTASKRHSSSVGQDQWPAHRGRRHSSRLDRSSRCWAWIFQASPLLTAQQLAWTRCGGLKYLLAVWVEVAGSTHLQRHCVIDTFGVNRIVFFTIHLFYYLLKSIFAFFLLLLLPSSLSISLQTEIAKRLNVICAQLIPFLSHEVRWDQHTLSPTAAHHETHMPHCVQTFCDW